MAEKQIENKIKNELKNIGAYFNKNYGGAYSKKGRPDIEGVFKGFYFAIEVKQSTGTPTPIQLKNLHEIADNGGLAFLACSTDVCKILLDPLSFKVDTDFLQHVKLEDDSFTIDFSKELWHKRNKGVTVIQITALVIN